ncbi:MAG TPA: glycoside hydrolase family 97 N-terminal domain-containing protein [Candidatus Acidoferrales bacterium]|nr:glycoside hydrolase family 97 N-terminal domain-containing protein [Candidatus Acidoferrales bacterium]
MTVNFLSRLFVVTGLVLADGDAVAAVSVTGPDGAVVATVQTTSGNLNYSVTFHGQTVIEASALGVTVNGTNIGSGVTIGSSSTYATNEMFPSRHGIHALGVNNYQAQLINLNHAASGLACVLDVRVYSNGLAFRYEFTGAVTKNITAEASSFVIPDTSTVWSQNNTSVYEAVFTGTNIALMPNSTVLGPPATIQLPGTNGFLALTESTLGSFGDPYLTKVTDASGRKLQVTYPANQGGGTGASASGAINTPWNVIMIGADLNSLVNNDIVESLAPLPDATLFPEGTFTSWATTGRSVWDWLRPQPGGITYTNAMTNSLWASRLGFEYNTVDSGWSSWNGGNPWPQVQQVTDFSHALGVKVLLWKTSSELNTVSQRTNFFNLLQAYGADGFKADFFDFSSANASAKERVKLQEDILRDAAAYHLVANFHGSTKPTGQFRTWPNLIEVEAVFGKEQFLSSVATMPVPFTRFLAGPADFTPMLLGGQSAYEIANAINMPGPIITYAERSDTIAGSAYASLIRAIPSQWDETIVLPQSQLGTTVATARRKGQDWFIGIMNTVVTQSWTLPLTFLSSNTTYQAHLIRETSSNLERTTVTRDSTLSVTITNTGGSGFVARLFKDPPFTVSPSQLLTGTVIGTSGSFANSGNTRDKVFDGNLTTFFDAPTTSGAWVGLDLGAGNTKAVTTVRYCPRANWSTRMFTGLFQGANVADFSDAVPLYVVGYTPPEGMYTSSSLSNRTVFRYLRYVSPPNGSCNVSEIQFYGVSTNRTSVSAHLTPTNTMAVTWPATYTGWRLQTQPIGTGISNAWSEVPGSATNSELQIPLNPDSAGALFRLVYP